MNGKEATCCLRCGWTPLEGIKEYRSIHGNDAYCIRCNESLVNQPDPYLKVGEPD